ncbi:hypothetical protein VTI28DRAFT_7300 [Corynascus sepedonium]
MRLRMMPTTKKKLGSIGLFMRQADGTLGAAGGPQAGSTSSPRAAGVGHPAGPATPAPALSGPPRSASRAGHSHLPQLQPPHEIVAARQEQRERQQQQPESTPATSRSIPVPKSGRYAAASQPTATMSLPAQHFHPMQRTRTSASDTAREAPRGHNAWEDSTVASMFGDNESRAASERLRVPQAGHSRHYSDVPPPQRALPAPPSRVQPKHDETLPFVIGENGMLKVIPPHSAQKAPETAPAPLAINTSPGGGALFDDQSVRQDGAYHEARQIFETPTKSNGLRRTKLAYRDNRDLRSNGSSERTGPGYSPESQGVSLSPERPAEGGAHIDKIRLQERMARDRERQREREREREEERQREQERELQRQRSTLFDNLTPLEFDDPDFNDTKAAVVAPSSAIDAEALKEALQRTPRANRQPQKQLFSTQGNNNIFSEAPPPLGRTASRRQKSPTKELGPAAVPITTATTTSRKRRQSLDYNDAELHAMSYSELRGQAFDFDPQTAALQQPSLPPAGGSIEDRLEHYKTKGTLDQHQFFTQISIDEWNEAGDWFLAQFGTVMQRLKEARRTKRRLVQQFEDEIAAREEAVRGKIENIGRTLEDLRQEGQTMMEGKDVDMEF